MKKHYGFALLIAASGGLAVAGVPVDGPDSLEIRSATVRYDAAEIDDRKSAKRLFFDIRRAAEEVCRISSHPRGYEIWHEHDCEADAVKQAVGDADIPALDQYYGGSSAVIAPGR